MRLQQYEDDSIGYLGFDGDDKPNFKTGSSGYVLREKMNREMNSLVRIIFNLRLICMEKATWYC